MAFSPELIALFALIFGMIRFWRLAVPVANFVGKCLRWFEEKNTLGRLWREQQRHAESAISPVHCDDLHRQEFKTIVRGRHGTQFSKSEMSPASWRDSRRHS